MDRMVARAMPFNVTVPKVIYAPLIPTVRPTDVRMRLRD